MEPLMKKLEISKEEAKELGLEEICESFDVARVDNGKPHYRGHKDRGYTEHYGDYHFNYGNSSR